MCIRFQRSEQPSRRLMCTHVFTWISLTYLCTRCLNNTDRIPLASNWNAWWRMFYVHNYECCDIRMAHIHDKVVDVIIIVSLLYSTCHLLCIKTPLNQMQFWCTINSDCCIKIKSHAHTCIFPWVKADFWWRRHCCVTVVLTCLILTAHFPVPVILAEAVTPSGVAADVTKCEVIHCVAFSGVTNYPLFLGFASLTTTTTIPFSFRLWLFDLCKYG